MAMKLTSRVVWPNQLDEVLEACYSNCHQVVVTPRNWWGNPLLQVSVPHRDPIVPLYILCELGDTIIQLLVLDAGCPLLCRHPIDHKEMKMRGSMRG